MSQKEDATEKSDDKWREFAKRTQETESPVNFSQAEHSEAVVDDEHLLPDQEPVVADASADTVLRDKIKLLETELVVRQEQLLRAQAEFDNTRRRMEQEISKAHKFGVERLLSELIPVVESLTRGLDGISSDDNAHLKAMRQGIELTLELLRKILEKNGVMVIAPTVGDAFDPAQHEAMSMRADPVAVTNTIITVLQQGYALHGRVLRAAMVIVAA